MTVLSLAALQARAYNFEPVEMEWAAWPDWCKARYAQTKDYGVAAAAAYARRLPPGKIGMWESALGPAWLPLHHYCAGRAYLLRAAREHDRQQREYLYERAIGESSYSFNRIPSTHWMAAEIATTMAQAHDKLGQVEQATKLLTDALAAHPKTTVAYAVLANIQRRRGDLEAARATLEKGNEAVEGKSSEIHYFLGLTLVELKRYDEAVEHARKAYALGYPLPGLRNKLKAAGHWDS